MYNKNGDFMNDTNKLKIIRREKGYTVYDMAKLLKITPSYYSQIENRKRRLFYDMAFKIATIFNMNPDAIFYTKDNI